MLTKLNRTSVQLGLLILAIGVFQIATLRAGHRWGDDFAAFILQTVHMATGQGFIPHEFIPNPETQLGGQTYPPVTSILLLPVYWIFGLSLTPMKIVGVICFLGALVFVYLLFEDRLPASWRLVLVALVGLNPTLFDVRDDIESTRPFLLLLFWALYLMDRTYKRAPREVPGWSSALWIGMAIFAACETRNVGFALFPTMLFLDLWSYRRITKFAIVTLAIAGLPTLLVSRLLVTTEGYGHLYNFSPRWLLHSLFVFSTHAQRVWWAGTPRLIAYAVGGAALLLAAWGLRLCLKQRPGPTEFLIPFYLGVVLPYFAPWYYPYFYPLIPMYMCYMLMGIRDLTQPLRPRIARAIVAAAAIVALALYGSDYARANWGPYHEGIGDPEFVQLCEYIKANTAPSDVFLFRKPRLLALLTGRPSSVYTMHLDHPVEPVEIWNWAEHIDARYLVIPFVPDQDVSSPNQDLMRFVDQYHDRVRLTHQTEHFKMYRLN